MRSARSRSKRSAAHASGARHTRLLPDGWTVVTKDRKLSAQWEHTVAVTRDGVEILTRVPGDDNEL